MTTYTSVRDLTARLAELMEDLPDPVSVHITRDYVPGDVYNQYWFGATVHVFALGDFYQWLEVLGISARDVAIERRDEIEERYSEIDGIAVSHLTIDELEDDEPLWVDEVEP
jgi:hypothetical protein